MLVRVRGVQRIGGGGGAGNGGGIGARGVVGAIPLIGIAEGVAVGVGPGAVIGGRLLADRQGAADAGGDAGHRRRIAAAGAYRQCAGLSGTGGLAVVHRQRDGAGARSGGTGGVLVHDRRQNRLIIGQRGRAGQGDRRRSVAGDGDAVVPGRGDVAGGQGQCFVYGVRGVGQGNGRGQHAGIIIALGDRRIREHGHAGGRRRDGHRSVVARRSAVQIDDGSAARPMDFVGATIKGAVSDAVHTAEIVAGGGEIAGIAAVAGIDEIRRAGLGAVIQ